MADDKSEDAGPTPDLGRPKRAPPTIELEATDVSPAIASASSASSSGASSSEADAQAEAGIASAEAAPDVAADSVPRASRRPPVLIPALSGAIAAGFVVGIAWWMQSPASTAAPEVAPPQVSGAAFDDLKARLARVETRPAAPPIAAPSPSPSPSPAVPDAATVARIDALEKSVTALRGDLSAARSASETATAAVKQIQSAPREVAVPPDLSGVNERLAQIERAAGALKTETAQQSAKPADDKPLRRVVAASLLDGQVRQGEPYAAALEQAKSLAGDANALAPLNAFAATGVPTVESLSRDLLALPISSPPSESAAAGAGIVDRLQAGAARLVRIQRTDAVAGDDRGAIVARASAAARRNDIVQARRELGTLAPADRAAAQSWIDKVDARDAAFAASRQFAADAMAALTKPAP